MCEIYPPILGEPSSRYSSRYLADKMLELKPHFLFSYLNHFQPSSQSLVVFQDSRLRSVKVKPILFFSVLFCPFLPCAQTCGIVFARSIDLVTWPYYLIFRFLAVVRKCSIDLMICFILLPAVFTSQNVLHTTYTTS